MGAPGSISRRGFLTGGRRGTPFRPRPPGVSAGSLSACTGCGACATACPEGILDIEQGRVVVRFDRGECTLCGACAEACPEPVFDPADLRMSHEVEIGPECLAHAGISCMTCRDACPETAIRARPRVGGPFLPELDASACTGCGACIAPCPADAIHPVPKEAVHA